MYNLADFVPYVEGSVTTGEHKVLAWSKKDGYYFTKFGYCVDPSIQVIAMEVKK